MTASPPSHGCLLVLTYARASHLDALLDSIGGLTGSTPLPLVVVRQLGDPAVGEVLDRRRSSIDVLIETDGYGREVPENIGRNRLIGYAAAFEATGADWVLAVEEDVILAADTADFAAEMVQRFRRKRAFRGVNLGSRLPLDDAALHTFCRTRFGIYGQASVMPARTWKRLRSWGVTERARHGHWDGAMEAYAKTGFMIAPNHSRYEDHGWGGSHMSTDAGDPYFTDLAASFTAQRLPSAAYAERHLGYWWRSDLRQYRRAESARYWLVFLLSLLDSGERWRDAGRRIRDLMRRVTRSGWDR